MPKPKDVSRLRPVTRPKRHIAFALDFQGKDDDKPTLLFAGAEEEWLVALFKRYCNTPCGPIKGFTIERQHPPVWRNGYVNERLAVILDIREEGFLSAEGLMVIVKRQLADYTNGGYVDCYTLDDFLNLRGRQPEKIIEPQPIDTTVMTRKRRKSAPKKKKQTETNKVEKEEADMANIYLRVPWYVAAYYRGREEDNQLTEFDPIEFADYSHEYMVLENNLRFMPEELQSRNCFSQKAWQNILHGKKPTGGEVIIRREAKDWPSGKEICTLIGAAYHGKQASSEYLCIRIPREIYCNKHAYRTNSCYCLSYDTGIYLSSMLTRKFCYEYLEWTEYDKEFARRQGIKRKTVETVERFFTQFNFPAAILPTERESLRRMHTRWLTNAKKRPAYHYNFDDNLFLEHISQEDREKAERRAKKSQRN